MQKVKLKNEKSLNPCTQCDLLTYNGKNSLCNTYNSSTREYEKPIATASPKKRKEKVNKPRGKQLQKYSKTYGRTIKRI